MPETKVIDAEKLEGAMRGAGTKSQFRGVAVHIAEDGKCGLEPVGVTLMEIYGALTLIMERIRKQLGSD